MGSSKDLGELMKAGMRRLASGVSVVCSRDAQGQPYAMTASSITSLSAEPASLLVCINKAAAITGALSIATPFVVNILRQGQEDISNVCAGAEPAERFKVGQWQDNAQGVPCLQGCEVSFGCEVDRLVDYGTHTIVIGRIVEIGLGDDSVQPLIYCDGSYQ